MVLHRVHKVRCHHKIMAIMVRAMDMDKIQCHHKTVMLNMDKVRCHQMMDMDMDKIRVMDMVRIKMLDSRQADLINFVELEMPTMIMTDSEYLQLMWMRIRVKLILNR